MLKFKTPKLKAEYNEISPRLRMVLESTAAWIAFTFDKDLIITSLLRDKGVHKYGNGADARSSNFTDEEGDATVEFVNSNFVYDDEHDTLHDERIGVDGDDKPRPGWTAPHFHFQVNWRDEA